MKQPLSLQEIQSSFHLHCCIDIFMHVVSFPAHTITLPTRKVSTVCLYKTAKLMNFMLVWNMCLLVNELCKSKQIKANKCNSRSQRNTDNTCTQKYTTVAGKTIRVAVSIAKHINTWIYCSAKNVLLEVCTLSKSFFSRQSLAGNLCVASCPIIRIQYKITT